MKNKKKTLLTLLTVVIFGLIIAIGINRFFYSWTDYTAFFSCTAKTASSPKIENLINERKLEFFTKIKFSYESLHNDTFVGKIRNNSKYTVEKAPDNGSTKVIKITRIYHDGVYEIRFYHVWKQIGYNSSSKIYDGIGVNYSVYGNCGVPNYKLEKNLRLVINELPLEQELRDEMNEKLSLEFSTQRVGLRLF